MKLDEIKTVKIYPEEVVMGIALRELVNMLKEYKDPHLVASVIAYQSAITKIVGMAPDEENMNKIIANIGRRLAEGEGR